MNIVVTANKKYKEPLRVMLRTLDTQTKEKYNLFILSNEKELDTSFVRLDFLKNCNKIVVKHWIIGKQYYISKKITKTTYLKNLVHEILPNEIEKCIVLDLDLIVRWNIAELYDEIDFKKNPDVILAAKIDPFSKLINFTPLRYIYKYYREIKMWNYFNSGVMVLNLKKMRELNFSNLVNNFTNKYGKFFMHDQDIYNYIINNKKTSLKYIKLRRKWNWALGFNFVARSDKKTKPYIIHFQGKYKPWGNKKNKKRFSFYWGRRWQYEWEKINDSLNNTLKKPIHIAFNIDDKFIKHAKSTINSITLNSINDLVIHIFHFGMLHGNEFSEMEGNGIKIFYHNVSAYSGDLMGSISKKSIYAGGATMGRLLIGEILPELKKIIYLDSDYIFNDDISKLWNIVPNMPKKLYGVRDFYWRINSMKILKRKFSYFKELERKDYINAGLLIFSPSEWYANSIYKKSINILLDYNNKVKFNDQDILNIIYKGKIKHIDPSWNIQAANIFTRWGIFTRYRGIHYNNFIKPWDNTRIKYVLYGQNRINLYERNKK